MYDYIEKPKKSLSPKKPVNMVSKTTSPVIQRVPALSAVAYEHCKNFLNRRGQIHAGLVAGLGHIAQTGIPHPVFAALLVSGFPRNAIPLALLQMELNNYYAAHPNAVNLGGVPGPDVGNLDPAAMPAVAPGNRGMLLRLLQNSLTNIMLPWIRNSIAQGQAVEQHRAPMNLHNRHSGITDFVHGNAAGSHVPGIAQYHDDQIRGGLQQFATMLDHSGILLPRVTAVDGTLGAAIGRDGEMDVGFATGRSQIVHETGHHLENNLSVKDYATLHNFLRARTRATPPNNERTVGYSTGLTGYDAELPDLTFQNPVSKAMRADHSIIKTGLFNMGNMLLSLPFDFLNFVTNIPSYTANLFGADLPHFRFFADIGQGFIDRFFTQESNRESTSYATEFTPSTPANPSTCSTEFLSTTAEIVSTESGAIELIAHDPTRALLFVYLCNKHVFNQISVNFQGEHRNYNAAHPGAALPAFPLGDFLHIV